MAKWRLLLPFALVVSAASLAQAAPAPTAASEPSGVEIPYERYLLANGLEVI